MFDVMKLIKIAQVAGSLIQAGGEVAGKLKAGFAKAGVEVTEAEWDALEAGFGRIEDVAKREMGATE